jgi:hypothetical protein
MLYAALVKICLLVVVLADAIVSVVIVIKETVPIAEKTAAVWTFKMTIKKVLKTGKMIKLINFIHAKHFFSECIIQFST